MNIGGMQRVMSELLWNLAENKFADIHLILYGRNRKDFYTIPDSVKIYKPQYKIDNYGIIRYLIYIIFYLRKTVKKTNPYSILSFGEVWNNIVLISLLFLKFKIFVSDRCKPDKSLGIIQDIFRKILYKKATGVIVQTEKAKNIYSKNAMNKNVIVIGNPIKKTNENNFSITKENIILTAGRFIPSKNFELLIDIFLKVQFADWKLVILGDDVPGYSIKNKLKRKIKDKNGTNKVCLEGNVKNINEYYLKSKIFAFTSSSEGFPNVIGEAMSMGLPIVAFDCVAGPSDLITDNETGFLIKLLDLETFSEKLLTLMHDANKREEMGRKGKVFIEKYASNVITEKYFNVLV